MQKIVIASDIHGSAHWCALLLQAFENEGADKLLLLGDLLYHGPRNDFPDGYEPRKVFDMLNRYADKIIAIRGNCDSEVDQMVLDFPIMADYALITDEDKTLFATHGHLFNEQTLPPMTEKTALLNGHFHTPKCEKLAKGLYVNCGSVSLPKTDTPHSYIVYEQGEFIWKDLETGGIFDCAQL